MNYGKNYITWYNDRGMMRMISLIQRFDSSILLYIKYNMHGIIMDKVMVISTQLGNSGSYGL